MGFDLGFHSEVYADATEFMQRPPENGIVLAFDDPAHGGVVSLLQDLAANGSWLPVVAMSFDPDPGAVVSAVKAGALDYFKLPLDESRVTKSVNLIVQEAKAHIAARRKMAEARSRIASLSPREREVLDCLSEGFSNKMIARELEISPRTVEIHRSNMMTKLGAEHSSHAVKLRLEAAFERENLELAN